MENNVIMISDINTFEGMKNGINNDCKDVYFVRAIGVNASYLQDIRKLDDSLLTNMNAGRGYYYRCNSLLKMQNVEDSVFYSKCYTDWTDGGRKELFTRATEKNKLLAEMLSNACTTVEMLFKKENTQATESIVKNFIVKLLFWYDSIFANERFHFDEKQVVKIVASNIVKKQEYLFFYLVTLMGCDVLLLQSKGDIGAEEEKLELSKKFVLGEFSAVEIPEYQWRETRSVGQVGSSQQNPAVGVQGQSTVNSNGRITVKLPERNRPSKHPAQTSSNQNTVGAQGNHRVVIPPRPGSAQTTASQRPGMNQSPNTGRAVNITTHSRYAVPVAASPEVEKSFEELAMLASSVVLITVYDGKGERLGSGSGIMIGKEGYILTNNHVAAGGRCFSVRIEDDDKEYKTDEIIKYHSVLDLAIIRIQRKLNPIPVYKGSKPLVRGQKVVAIGSPLGLFNSVSDGIISGFRKIDDVDMIQFTAPTSRGSSGGAVLNMQGEVIGISTAGIDAGQNINLAMGYECINMFIRGFI